MSKPSTICEYCGRPWRRYICPSCAATRRVDKEPIFKNCNVCGRELQEKAEFAVGACAVCMSEGGPS